MYIQVVVLGQPPKAGAVSRIRENDHNKDRAIYVGKMKDTWRYDGVQIPDGFLFPVNVLLELGSLNKPIE